MASSYSGPKTCLPTLDCATLKTATTSDVDWFPIVDTLADDPVLEPPNCDHALSGEWKNHRDCHIKPDPVLISRELSHTAYDKKVDLSRSIRVRPYI